MTFVLFWIVMLCTVVVFWGIAIAALCVVFRLFGWLRVIYDTIDRGIR